MLRGTREAVIHKMQPISIHGQLLYDIHYLFVDESDAPLRFSRIGPEAIAPGVQPGDHVTLDFVVGVVTSVKRLPA